MNRVTYFAVMMIFLPLIGITVADEEDKETRPIQLVVELSDGSRVIGSPTPCSLMFHTSFADLDIPIALIRGVHLKNDNETAFISFWNGDKLSGVMAQDSVVLTTLFGKVTVDVAHVRRLGHFAAPVFFVAPDLSAADLDRVVQYRNKYFLHVKKNMTWQAAADWCKKRGATLACIGDEKENEFVCQLVRCEDGESFWGGGTDHDCEGQWKWMDGTAFNYTNWTRRQPDNSGGREHYLQIHLNGVWNDHTPIHMMPFVAQWTNTQSP